MDMGKDNNIDWAKIIEITDSYENIPFIIEGGLGKNPEIENYLFSVLNNTDNVFLETHNLTSLELLDNLVRCGSSKRLLYGSGFPYFDTQATTSFLKGSSLKIRDKINISYGNIKKIFDEIAI
jgi:predicted TIM-barrel fold metal-dependent hydrolase